MESKKPEMETHGSKLLSSTEKLLVQANHYIYQINTNLHNKRYVDQERRTWRKKDEMETLFSTSIATDGRTGINLAGENREALGSGNKRESSLSRFFKIMYQEEPSNEPRLKDT